MLYKNIEIHNIAELIYNDDGSISWKRVPSDVHKTMELPSADGVVHNSTGVELRFVIKGESATIRMSTYENDPKVCASFHVFRGGIQGGWEDLEIHRHVTGEIQDFVIEKAKNIDKLNVMTEKCGTDWDPNVVRVIFNSGRYKIYDIIGDVVPPTKEQCPKKTLLCYGSSITHGSSSLDRSHSWASLVGYNLNMDVRNLGMAGSCAIEPAMADYIASEGEKGNWDVATLELGINVLAWQDDKIISRVNNIINEVASRNPEKPIFVISPFYHCGEDFAPTGFADKWRNIIEDLVTKSNFKNVKHINGFEVLDNMSYMSADEVHPNIYGVQRIADILTEKLRDAIK